MNINELIAIVKSKIEAEIVMQDFKIEDKSFLHKNHKGNQEGMFHLKIIIKSEELKKLNKIDFMTNWLTKNKLGLIGLLVGAIAGFLYWNYVGCASGTCMITSKPINSTLYGSLMGYLLFNIFKKEEQL